MTSGTDADVELDTRVLEMRTSGKSYASIAKALELGRARDATTAFIRAVRRSSPADQERLREEELRRLEALEIRVRSNEELAPFDRDTRLAVLVKLRERLLAP